MHFQLVQATETGVSIPVCAPRSRYSSGVNTPLSNSTKNRNKQMIIQDVHLASPLNRLYFTQTSIYEFPKCYPFLAGLLYCATLPR